jgi:SAM-dependent methyltransferase
VDEAMSRLSYRIMYSVGFKPWEQETEAEAPQLRELLDREEQGRQSLGMALDLGCGTGRWSLELARRGWGVTGIDVVPKAIAAARQRARDAGVENIRFVEGDVTALSDADVGSGYRFLLDAECFNHLTDEQRRAMGREVDAVAASDATMLLLVWRRARRGPFPAGASRQDVEGAFKDWRVTNEDSYTAKLPVPLRRINPRWYRLARS